MGERVTVVVPDEGLTTSLEVVHDGGYFIVADACWLIDSFAFGDTLELSSLGDGTWAFVRLVSPGGYDTHVWTLPEVAAQAEDLDLEPLFVEVRSRGGYVERAFGGLIFTALPSGTCFDLEAELRRVADRYRA